MRFLLAVVTVAVLVGSVAFAGQSPISLYAQGGLTLPNSPDEFKDAVDNGFNVGLGLGLNLGQLTVIGKGEVHRFGVGEVTVMGGGGTVVGEEDIYFKMWCFGVDLRLHLSPYNRPNRLYLMGGMGYWTAFMDEESFGDIGDAWDQATGDDKVTYINLGAGWEFGGGGTKFFVEGRYLKASFGDECEDCDDIVAIPLSAGIRFF